MKSIIVILPLLILAGCQTDQPATTVDLAPLSTQIGNLSSANTDLAAANARLSAANEALASENARLLSMLRADADAGRSANVKGWLPFERYVWEHQIALLPGLVPDKATADRWNEASTLYAAGGESAMQGIITSLQVDATAQAAKLGELLSKTEQLTRERDAANEAAAAALARVQQAEQDLVNAVAKAKADKDAEFAAKVKAWQVNAANWAGAGLGTLALAFAAGAFLLSAASKKLGEAAIVSILLCIGCFAFARFLGWPWFLPVVGGAYAVAGAVWAAWKVRSGMREKAAVEEAAKAATFVPYATMLVDVINEADKNATVAERPILDKLLFDPLKAADKTGQFDVLRHELETQQAIALAKSDKAL
jgi:outer membrane murein-binding lipoprotein Lpp